MCLLFQLLQFLFKNNEIIFKYFIFFYFIYYMYGLFISSEKIITKEIVFNASKEIDNCSKKEI